MPFYLCDEYVSQLGDLVAVGTALLLTLALAHLEAVQEALVKGEQVVHAGEQRVHFVVVQQQGLPQLVHVDVSEDLQGAHVVHLGLDQL